MTNDTIFARSSGSGRAGIAVWRISGPEAGPILDRLISNRPAPRLASHRVIRDGEGKVIDDGIGLWFPGPSSATGEDIAELHLHGSIAVGQKVAEVLSELGARPASPGEFTMRAFANGKMDLLEVEGLGDLLDAETNAQREQALKSGQGEGREKINGWRTQLTEALGTLEAAVDFPDEEDIPAQIAERCLPILQSVRDELDLEVAQSAKGQLLREGIDLAIIGPPNAGKSSLMNKLLGEDRAIVSDIPGTTRDIVSARFELGGRLINILDTAGIRDTTEDAIESEGIKRSRAIASQADLIIAVQTNDNQFEESFADIKTIRIVNKIDLNVDTPLSEQFDHAISVKTGQGWDAFLAHLTQTVEAQASPSLFPRERQQSLMRAAIQRIDHILQNPASEPELMSEDLRAAFAQLDQLVGVISTEDVLGAIFSSFCIGK